MKLKPLSDHVVIKPLEAEEKTAGGILLPDTAKEKSTRGECRPETSSSIRSMPAPRSRWTARS